MLERLQCAVGVDWGLESAKRLINEAVVLRCCPGTAAAACRSTWKVCCSLAARHWQDDAARGGEPWQDRLL